MMGFLQEETARRYLEGLQEERKKIQMFQRELPLCYELISQAIERYGQQMACDEETSINVPGLEEFIPIRRVRSVREEGEEESCRDVKSSGDHEQNQTEKKPDWSRSVRFWIQNPNPPKQEAKTKKSLALDANKAKGAFHPFRRKNTAVVDPTPALANTPTPTPPPLAAASSTGGAVGSGGGGHEKDTHSNRKPRRCWSPELHRRFLHAVQQLGGSHAATPKQIGELMKVDGLTNDEVKSHLQKYRLHTRRSNPSVLTGNCGSTQLVGGIWVPPPAPPKYTAAKSVTESSAATTRRIYAPVASVPTSSTCNNAEGNKSGGGDSTKFEVTCDVRFFPTR